MGEPTETDDLSSWKLIDAGPTVREPAWDRPRPSVCVIIVAWSPSKASNSEDRTSPWCLA